MIVVKGIKPTRIILVISNTHYLYFYSRSVHMRLYSMHKREFVMVFMAFFACFGLGIFIGIAGPPITYTKEINSATLLVNTSYANDKNIIATGPFIVRSPLMTTYSQQLWVIAKLKTDNNDGEYD